MDSFAKAHEVWQTAVSLINTNITLCTKKVHLDYETCDWVNKVVTILWRTYPKQIASLLVDQLMPSLKQNQPFLVVMWLLLATTDKPDVLIFSMHRKNSTSQK